jgi:hypothetical protein
MEDSREAQHTNFIVYDLYSNRLVEMNLTININNFFYLKKKF